MSGDNRYVPLLSLAKSWASDAAMPPEMVLRNVCDWAMTGGIPADALVTATGDKVNPFDIFMSRRALTARHGAGVLLDGLESHNPQWGMSLLAGVLVSESGVKALCEHTNTAPPSVLPRGSKRFWPAPRVKNRAPPMCPEAEECAAKYRARQFAAGLISQLRTTLAGLQGRPTRYGPSRSGDEAISLEHWEPRWRKTKESAQASVHRCGDVHLQQELDTLDSEWAAFVSTETQQQAAFAAPTVIDDAQALAARDANGSAAADRSAGQFSSSGLAAWYESWVADNTARGTIPSRDEEWEAAKAALGESVPRDRVRELRKTLAPSSWRRKGRRKLAGKIGEKS
jgi:hypothetical protein